MGCMKNRLLYKKGNIFAVDKGCVCESYTDTGSILDMYTITTSYELVEWRLLGQRKQEEKRKELELGREGGVG
jgi:hypothetical protein